LKVRFSILFPVLLTFRRLLQNAVIVRGMQLDGTNYSSVAYDLLNEMKAIGTTLHQEFADYNTMHRLYTRRVKKTSHLSSSSSSDNGADSIPSNIAPRCTPVRNFAKG